MVEVRPAERRDLDDLLTIEQQCFNVYYYDYYTLDRRQFELYMRDPDCLFLVAQETPPGLVSKASRFRSAGETSATQTRVVGYILGPVEVWRTPPRAHIDSIAVLPQMQHKGIGTRLLQSFLEYAGRQGCARVTLEVSAVNNVGLAFFAKHGFRQLRHLPDYYGKGLHGLLLAAPTRSIDS